MNYEIEDLMTTRDDKYYFIIENMETGLEIYRQEVIIDIAFPDDFV